MHDPKFEKEVQQKLEELKFTPSEAVWAKVEKAVNGEKKRRTPLFWLLTVPGMVAAAAIVYLVIGRTPPLALPKNSGIAKNAPSGNSVPSGNTGPAVAKASPDAASPGAVNPLSPASPSSVASSSSRTVRSTDRTSGLPGIAGAGDQQIAATDKTANYTGNTGKAKGYKNTAAGNGAGVETDVAGNVVARNQAVDRSGKSGTDMPGSLHRSTGQRTAGLVNLGAAVPRDIASGFPKIKQSLINQNAINTVAANKGAAARKIQLKPKRSWEAGYVGGIGLSSVNQALFERSVINSYYSVANAGTSVTGATQNPTSSKIKAGPSAWVGILMQRPVSSVLSVAVGMNLHYYSDRIQTGDEVTSSPTAALGFASLPLRPSLISSASSYAAPVPTSYPYYPTGTDHEFTNRYYFVELPVSVQWRINHSATLPIFWEGGVAASYLMSSDALYYDTNTDVYYKDGGVTNRTQVAVSTAVMAGLPFRGSRIQVGPQLQYSLIRMLNSSASGDGHLFYGGIKVVVLPGKGVNKL